MQVQITCGAPLTEAGDAIESRLIQRGDNTVYN